MDSEEEEEEEKSRSQLKREFHELKDLAEELAGLPSGRLEKVPMRDRTRAAIVAAQDMVRGPLKRQLGHVANLIEHEDVDAIRGVLSGTPHEQPAEVKVVSDAERWRDELIAGDDDSLMEFVEEHPEFDRQQLRQLVRKTRKERDRKKPPKSARKLLEYLNSRSAGNS